MFEDLRTTVTGAITTILGLLSHYNVVLSDKWTAIITSVGFGVALFFAKDSKKV